MTAISVALAAVVGVDHYRIRWGVFALLLVGMIFVHAATNLINDYFDVRHGVDHPESPTARYREHPIL